ncbi:MAG: AtpZ/AtpI family protein [Lachnospiraceae bacterium]|nr:AtpZ/AtpI family protein [Lachnospiraceae bacterium]
MKKKDVKNVFNTLPLVSQLGISLVVPLVFCLLICYWLTNRFSIGSWVYIPGIVFGLGAFVSTCYRIYKKETDAAGNSKKPLGFNEHN